MPENKTDKELEETIERLSKENKELRRKVHAAEKQKKLQEKKIEEEIRNRYEEKIAEYEKQINSYEKENKELKKRLEEAEEHLKKQFLEHKDKMSELLIKINDLESKYSKVVAEMNQLKIANRRKNPELLSEGKKVELIVYEKTNNGYLALGESNEIIFIPTKRKIDLGIRLPAIIIKAGLPQATAGIIDNPNVLLEVKKSFYIRAHETTAKGDLIARCKNGVLFIKNPSHLEEYEGKVHVYSSTGDKNVFFGEIK